MNIKVFHNNGQGCERDLYGALGAALTSRHLQDRLGMPVVSDPEDTWVVAFDDYDIAIGFALLHPQKHAAHIRFLVPFDPADDVVRDRLLETVVELVKEQATPMLYTNDRFDKTYWAERGFTVKPSKRRGTFRRWERQTTPPTKKTAKVAKKKEA